MIYYTILYYTVLNYTVLYCIVLYCTVLYCSTVMYCTVLYYTQTFGNATTSAGQHPPADLPLRHHLLRGPANNDNMHASINM